VDEKLCGLQSLSYSVRSTQHNTRLLKTWQKRLGTQATNSKEKEMSTSIASTVPSRR